MTRILASALDFLACGHFRGNSSSWPCGKLSKDGDQRSSGNCFEIYGTIDEKKYEIYYNPQTGEEMERVEG